MRSELSKVLEALNAGRLSFERAQKEGRRTAQELLAECGVKAPPVDLDLIARARNIVGYKERNIPEDGILYRVSPSALYVELRKSSSASRRAFTLAHEVGHTFFLSPDKARGEVAFRVVDADLSSTEQADSPLEERLCNIIAGEVIIPSRFVQEQLVTKRLSWQTVFSIQHRTRASLTACARRAVEEGIVKALLVLWAPRGQRGLGVKWTVGSPGLTLCVDSDFIAGKGTLPYAALNGNQLGTPVAGEMFLRTMSRGGDHYYSESILVSRARSEVLSLVILDSEAHRVVPYRTPRRRPIKQLDLFE